ncbi:hypothetical protein K491DRAFT_603031 [Lophiostoma macrostomum CBS 122681]|uniref:BTB domain-containing protein n=1 Tax=Lophiostoma macrostomum CBS 122681 TaxID=1314788 RepID=A0A6A6T2L4_9PLEO|nr:hypothetical protein K491DRAFT_603031 [Lophiostoma macrostomum CBS 122681]
MVAQGGTMIVEVGTEKKQYHVHKKLISAHSEYFRKALDGSWREAQDGKVVLDDIEPTTFNIFINWLYTQNKLATTQDWAKIADLHLEEPFEADVFIQAMITACAFGDRIIAPTFEQAVHNAIVDFEYWDIEGHAPRNAAVIYAFEHLPNNKEILDFIVDLRCAHWIPNKDSDEEKALEADLPHEFLLRCVKKLSPKEVKTTAKLCDYHRHCSSEDRNKCHSRTMQMPKTASADNVHGRQELSEYVRPSRRLGKKRPTRATSDLGFFGGSDEEI